MAQRITFAAYYGGVSGDGIIGALKEASDAGELKYWLFPVQEASPGETLPNGLPPLPLPNYLIQVREGDVQAALRMAERFNGDKALVVIPTPSRAARPWN